MHKNRPQSLKKWPRQKKLEKENLLKSASPPRPKKEEKEKEPTNPSANQRYGKREAKI